MAQAKQQLDCITSISKGMSQIKEGQNLISMGAGTKRLPHPHVSGSVAVRLSESVSVIVSVIPAYYTTGSKIVIYQR